MGFSFDSPWDVLLIRLNACKSIGMKGELCWELFAIPPSAISERHVNIVTIFLFVSMFFESLRTNNA